MHVHSLTPVTVCRRAWPILIEKTQGFCSERAYRRDGLNAMSTLIRKTQMFRLLQDPVLDSLAKDYKAHIFQHLCTCARARGHLCMLTPLVQQKQSECTCTRALAHVHFHLCMLLFANASKVNAHARVHLHMSIFIYACYRMYACTHAYVHAHVHAHLHTCAHTHAYTHAHMHARLDISMRTRACTTRGIRGHTKGHSLIGAEK